MCSYSGHSTLLMKWKLLSPVSPLILDILDPVDHALLDPLVVLNGVCRAHGNLTSRASKRAQVILRKRSKCLTTEETVIRSPVP